METSEPTARGRIHPNVFAGYRLQRERAPPPGRKKKIPKILNEALVKRIIPFIYRNRVWTMDESMWPLTLENFRELNHHLSDNLPNIHAGHQWQMIVYFFNQVERERDEWKRLDEMEREVMETVRRVMES